jgi:hypothetical protein
MEWPIPPSTSRRRSEGGGARSRSIHLGETGLYILDYVHARVFTSAKIEYCKMQWPTTELVFPHTSATYKKEGSTRHPLVSNIYYIPYRLHFLHGQDL